MQPDQMSESWYVKRAPVLCSECTTPTTLPGGRCPLHTREHNQQHRAARAYYHTTEWERLRRAVLNRDHNQCVICTSQHRLTAHHIHARKDGGPDTTTNLVTVCQSCHSSIETGNRATLDLLAEHIRISPPR